MLHTCNGMLWVASRMWLSSISKYMMHESCWPVKLPTCQLVVSSALCPHSRATMLPPDAVCIIQCTRKAIAGPPKLTLLHYATCIFFIRSCVLLGKVRRNALIALKPRNTRRMEKSHNFSHFINRYANNTEYWILHVEMQIVNVEKGDKHFDAINISTRGL